MHYALWHQVGKPGSRRMNVDDAVLNGWRPVSTASMVKQCSEVLTLARHVSSAMQSRNVTSVLYSDGPGKFRNGFIVRQHFRVCARPIRAFQQRSLYAVPRPQKLASKALKMKASKEALRIKIPRNQTVLMQHLQLLVIRGYRSWCGGTILRSKLKAFAGKMATHYPITRTTRGRCYDRKKGLAAAHFVVFPIDETRVAWWLLSDGGKGGLTDALSPDAHVAKNAEASDGHITFVDYVLLYAHKKDARSVPDVKTGRSKTVYKNMSTWTWKLNEKAFNELKASIEIAAKNLDFGEEGGFYKRPRGLLGILECQRSRPLFSAVRTQVIALHRHASDEWGRVKKKWQGGQSSDFLADARHSGELRPLKEIMSAFLPKMTRIRVYENESVTIADLARNL